MRSLLLILLLPTLFLAGCSNDSATLRYRVTAEFEVDGETYKGSGVREITITHTPNSLSGFGIGTKENGEAIVVDTGAERSAIYVLQRRKNKSAAFFTIFVKCFRIDLSSDNGTWIRSLNTYGSGSNCTVSLEDEQQPLIVAFADEAVPTSIFELASDDFKSRYGVDASFVELSIEIVQDDTPISSDIDERLSWLNKMPFNGSNHRSLDPIPDGVFVAAKDATLAQRVTELYFRED